MTTAAFIRTTISRRLGDSNTFTGIGDNQLGIELQGHSANRYTRYSVALVSASNGEPGLSVGRGYDVYFNVSHAFEVPRLGPAALRRL